MISMILPLSIGNALKVFLEPPAGALKWRLLRKGSDTFGGHNDAEAYLVYEGDEKFVVDSRFLQNDVTQYYKAYYWDGEDWSESNTAVGVAHADYEDGSTDVQSIVRERIEWGLTEEVRRGVLHPRSGSIPVLTAPPPVEDVRLPAVTVQVMHDASGERGLGELVAPDDFVSNGWSDDEGWLANVQLSIIGWSENPDERVALRQSLRRIIVGNLPVFNSFGMVQIDFSQADSEMLEGEMPAPIYQTIGTFSCLAPVIVGGRVPAIDEVISTARAIYDV